MFLSEQPDEKENNDNHQQYVDEIAASPSTSAPSTPSPSERAY
jgi:hypothetical protein